MTWKKNAFSYLIWTVYTLITGTALVSLGSMFCVETGVAAWWGILASALYMGIVGALVFLLHKGAGTRFIFAEKNPAVLLAAEIILAAGLLVLGCFQRVLRVGEAEEVALYFEMAEVAAGQSVPQTVHGAVHFYVRLLHVVFRFLGNQYAAGIWLQICLQLAGSLVLYFVMRRLSGVISALVTFTFCMCAPYMVQGALVLSPGTLYFLFLGIAAWLTHLVCGGRLRLPAFVFAGILAGLCCYIDIGGMLLLILAAPLAFLGQAGGVSVRKRVTAVGICLGAAILGFAAFIWADAFMSGKDFRRVAGAWFALYQSEGFRLPFTVGPTGSVWEGLGLFGLMAFGLFSFWCDKGREYYSLYVGAACAVMLAICFGIYTEEMPGYRSLYLIFAMLAGAGLKPCICSAAPAESLRGICAETAGGREGSHLAAAEGLTEGIPTCAALEKESGTDSEDAMEGEVRQDEEGRYGELPGAAAGKEAPKVRYLDNPLPLPKKHVKRVLDYSLEISNDDDFDYPIEENDDFDV